MPSGTPVHRYPPHAGHDLRVMAAERARSRSPCVRPSLCFDGSCLIRLGPVATDQLVDEITVLGTGIRLSEPRRVEKCHGIEIDHGDIAVRQPRKPSSRKINMSRRRG